MIAHPRYFARFHVDSSDEVLSKPGETNLTQVSTSHQADFQQEIPVKPQTSFASWCLFSHKIIKQQSYHSNKSCRSFINNLETHK